MSVDKLVHRRTSLKPRRRLLLAGAATAALTLALSGCSMGGWVYNANLPGGAKLGSHPLTLTADFADVLDLVPQSSVKLDDVAVGRVTKIALEPDGHSARVTLKVNRDADLPAGTTARLEQSSLLGEKFVALVPPTATTAQAGPRLQDGARLPLSSTSAAVEVEQVLGALSLVLNGGGIGQFQEISRELQKVNDGRTGEIKDFLTQLDRFVSTLNQRKDAITSALDGLDHLSKSLRSDDTKIANALDGLSPGMKVLAQQRPQLVAMLSSLNKLSNVTVATLDQSQKDMVADFKTLDPILTQLAKAGKDLPDSLQILLTYPFPDSVLGAIKGDYFNVFVTTNFRTVPSSCSGQGCAWPQVHGRVAARGSSKAVKPNALTAPTLLPPTDSPMPGAATSSVPSASILPSSSASASGSSQSSTPAASASADASSSLSPLMGSTDVSQPSGSSPASPSATSEGK
jgi:phospholipid/cholesterol/gamma-HCH transport system substrate-binding protein